MLSYWKYNELFIASSDYGNDFTNLITFTSISSSMICRDISVMADNVIEDTERFVVFMNSSDSAVILQDVNRTVLLLDSTSKLIKHRSSQHSIEN